MTQAPRCARCHTRIRWIQSITGQWLPFDPVPVAPGNPRQITAKPVENDRWWPVRDLIEDLQVRRQCTDREARTEVYDMPWHVPHTCPRTTDTEKEVTR